MLVLYPQFVGTLHHIAVKEGQYVKKGQILAKIDDGGLTQQLNQLKIQKNLAQTTYERQERLWKQNMEVKFNTSKRNHCMRHKHKP